MKIKEVEGMLASIADHASINDDELAHMEEDNMYTRVLEAIAEGVPNAKALAAAVLKTKSIRFNRRCA